MKHDLSFHSQYLNKHALDSKSRDEVHGIRYNFSTFGARLRLRLALFTVLAAASFLAMSSSLRIPSAVLDSPWLFKPTTYEIVPGFFAQGLNSTNDTTFDFVSTLVIYPS